MAGTRDSRPGRDAAWSAPLRVTVVPIAGNSAASDATKLPRPARRWSFPCTFMRQRKDTRLLCLDGDNEGDPATSYPEEAWDAEHPVDNP